MSMDIVTAQRIELACARLIQVYANLNDAGLWEDVAALYTQDAVFCRPSAPGEEIRGREAILESFLTRPVRVTCHLVTNIVVDVLSESEARAFSRIVLYQAESGPGGMVARHSQVLPLIGAFKDRAVLANGSWKFAERRGEITIR